MVEVITSTDMPGSMRIPLVVRKCLVVIRYFAISYWFDVVLCFSCEAVAGWHIYNKELAYIVCCHDSSSGDLFLLLLGKVELATV